MSCRLAETSRLQKEGLRQGRGLLRLPFAMEHPQFRYEIQNGFVDPSRDQMPGAAKEWFLRAALGRGK
jgi:hypothetical protein